MNVLRNQEYYIDDSVEEYLSVAEDIKIGLIDAYFEDKVGIDNVEAGFKVYEEAEKITKYIYSVKNRIYDEDKNTLVLLRCLKRVICVIRQRTSVLERVLENL